MTLIAYLTLSSDVHGWQYMLTLGSLPLLVVFVGYLSMDESPRYLAMHGDREQARRVLERAAEKKKVILDQGEIESEELAKDTPRWESVQLLFSVRWRQTTLLIWMLWFANAFCYYGVVVTTSRFSQVQGQNNSTCVGNNPFLGQDYVNLVGSR